jgi:protein-L-isoaspartate O-methyltransferase
MAMSEEETAHLQQDLVEAIRPFVQDQNILHAFEIIPRHEFVGDFYEWDYTDHRWECVAKASPGWLKKVYTNIQLVTSLNQYDKPNVSSSKPDIMASKIQSLKLQPGHRVLEIGTGTGYNAALVGAIVGPQNVVTIDINETLLAMARARIESAIGPGVTVLHADGRNLPEDLRNFDAIIVTGSHDHIEPSWIHALNQQGRLIVNWNKCFSKVFFELEKQDSGLLGTIASFSGDFMYLHDGGGIEPTQLSWDTAASTIEETDFRDELIKNSDFGFFLQIHIPSLIYSRFIGKTSNLSYYVVTDARQRIVYFSKKVRGNASLWKEITLVQEKFGRLGKPGRQEMSLKVDSKGNMTFFHHGDEIVTCS